MDFIEEKFGELLTIGIGLISFIAWLVRLESKVKMSEKKDDDHERRIGNIEKTLPTFLQQMNNLVADIREIKTNIRWLIQRTDDKNMEK